MKNPDTQEVCHIMINNVQDLDKLRLSKYYQSDTKMCISRSGDYLCKIDLYYLVEQPVKLLGYIQLWINGRLTVKLYGEGHLAG